MCLSIVGSGQVELEPREGHLVVVRRFVETVQSSKWEGQLGEEGLRRACIIDACYASALERREVTLEGLAPAEELPPEHEAFG